MKSDTAVNAGKAKENLAKCGAEGDDEPRHDHHDRLEEAFRADRGGETSKGYCAVLELGGGAGEVDLLQVGAQPILLSNATSATTIAMPVTKIASSTPKNGAFLRVLSGRFMCVEREHVSCHQERRGSVSVGT